MDRVRRVLVSRFLWIFAGLFLLSFAANRWVEAEGGPRAVVAEWGVWAPLAAFVLQTVTSMTPIGAILIAVVNGMLFELWVAILINIASGVVGGVVMYLLWRRGDHEFDIRTRMEALPRWFRRHAGDNVWFLSSLRLFPWAGGRVADLIAGSHRIPLRTQLLSLVLGYLPGSILYALTGAGLLHL
jgi:uncharacterized membrane protein YdjX (TVP38/TMEM64 family)